MKYFASAILLFAVLIGATFGAPTDKPVKGAHFDRIVAIIFENANYDEAIQQPYLQDLINRTDGLLLSNYHGPNYIATIFGSTAGITDDGAHNLPDVNLVDLLEAKQISWKGYMETYPGNCFNGTFAPSQTNQSYARKHNPFINMQDVITNPTRCAKIVELGQLDTDINDKNVPQYAYVVPNQIHDGHGISALSIPANLTAAMEWFQDWFEPKLKEPSFTTNTLFLIYFDEDDPNTTTNHIYAALLGQPVHPPPDHTDDGNYNHYSFLATVEENWDLGNLGRLDANATLFTKYLKSSNK
ncbi:12725_t:CDS:2 [Cetraspora pellucida]|uniref:12725_t:CDS:1 n=1 Tax=Cetraspora pellucida TaxID=1433469 RepID=A0A9N9NZJ1_9GLOM|nr:12725_t:CDS:2 [Cetraspora pellucida]